MSKQFIIADTDPDSWEVEVINAHYHFRATSQRIRECSLGSSYWDAIREVLSCWEHRYTLSATQGRGVIAIVWRDGRAKGPLEDEITRLENSRNRTRALRHIERRLNWLIDGVCIGGVGSVLDGACAYVDVDLSEFVQDKYDCEHNL